MMKTDARIARIDGWIVRVPLLQEWAASPEFGEHTAGDDRLILRIEDSDGIEGWGESPFRASETALNDPMTRLVGKVIAEFRPAFLDLWPPNSQYWQRPTPPSAYTPHLANLQHRLRHPMQTLVEMALCDLTAKRAKMPLHQLWGGPWREGVLTDYWMGRVTPTHAQKCVKRALQLGFHGVKLKTTLEDPNVERLEAIRDVAGSDFKITVDPNGRLYRLDDALPTIRAMDSVGNMAILEDPFPRFHLAEFAELRRRIHARVAVHVDPPESLWNVLQSGAAGGLNLGSHPQGLWNWRFSAATAERANLPVWHGSGLDLGIYTAAQLHLAAATPNCQLPGDQCGPWLRKSHLLKHDFQVEKGCVAVPQGPGLGVEVDFDQIEKYTVQTHSWKEL